jgi:hypothetical protein
MIKNVNLSKGDLDEVSLSENRLREIRKDVK